MFVGSLYNTSAATGWVEIDRDESVNGLGIFLVAFQDPIVILLLALNSLHTGNSWYRNILTFPLSLHRNRQLPIFPSSLSAGVENIMV